MSETEREDVSDPAQNIASVAQVIARADVLSRSGGLATFKGIPYGGSISASNRRAPPDGPGGGRLMGARFTIRVPAADSRQ